ncbi:CYTH domain-containing protein [Neobacillus sp. PS3-40]|uniref:CYTH domain-containing protein n=1 Tax=Neobacillus sp. PS3-40 TaxID=3070679 RepID=UPI0027E126E5|nr:CYTH domain-containing protein [Neobacillus sp. PS3-40]WML43394.1 CYTH domain-containing protein [Neobacillus sp. PS3-40]
MILSQNIEIEFKNLLIKEEYERLISFFSLPEDAFFTQENHYFDTSTFDLKEQNSALRIRQKGNHFEMTLKQPATDGLLETNQILSKEEASIAFSKGILPVGMIQNLVSKMEIPFSNLMYFGSLTTKRAEFNYENGLLVLDYSSYLNKEDYEVEYEVENYQRGKQLFLQFLNQHGIPQRETKNKIVRFYLEMKKNLGQS